MSKPLEKFTIERKCKQHQVSPLANWKQTLVPTRNNSRKAADFYFQVQECIKSLRAGKRKTRFAQNVPRVSFTRSWSSFASVVVVALAETRWVEKKNSFWFAITVRLAFLSVWNSFAKKWQQILSLHDLSCLDARNSFGLKKKTHPHSNTRKI